MLQVPQRSQHQAGAGAEHDGKRDLHRDQTAEDALAPRIHTLLSQEGLDAGANPPPPPSRPLAAYLMDCERDYLRMVLEQHGGHMTHTAETLGITRKTLWEKMRRLGLQAREDL